MIRILECRGFASFVVIGRNETNNNSMLYSDDDTSYKRQPHTKVHGVSTAVANDSTVIEFISYDNSEIQPTEACCDEQEGDGDVTGDESGDIVFLTDAEQIGYINIPHLLNSLYILR